MLTLQKPSARPASTQNPETFTQETQAPKRISALSVASVALAVGFGALCILLAFIAKNEKSARTVLQTELEASHGVTHSLKSRISVLREENRSLEEMILNVQKQLEEKSIALEDVRRDLESAKIELVDTFTHLNQTVLQKNRLALKVSQRAKSIRRTVERLSRELESRADVDLGQIVVEPAPMVKPAPRGLGAQVVAVNEEFRFIVAQFAQKQNYALKQRLTVWVEEVAFEAQVEMVDGSLVALLVPEEWLSLATGDRLEISKP